MVDDTAPHPAPPILERQTPERAERSPDRGLDLWLLAAVLGLLVIGTIQVFAASATMALDRIGDSTYFLKRQLVFATLGVGVLWLSAHTHYGWLRRAAYPLLLVAVLLLIAVLFFGTTFNAAKRWLILGPISVQPVEIAKLALVTYLALSLAKKADRVKTFTVGFVPHLIVCGVMMALLIKQPDLGSAIILGATTLAMLFVAGTNLSYIVMAVLTAAPIAYHFIVGTPWRLQRFLAFLNPEAFSQTVAYQIVQAKIAIGSGGVTGTGLGQGRQQLGYMPEGHNDFIMASVGEELGFIGFALVLVLFAIIVWRGVRAALGARDVFASYLAFGITLGFALQALVNTAVVLGAMPAKGLTLPFVSYGGSSLLVSMYLAGILLSIGKNPPPRRARRRSGPQRVAGARRRRARAVIVRE
jgi:cell division protein FtsW